MPNLNKDNRDQEGLEGQEKRTLILSTLSFLARERNKCLFRIGELKLMEKKMKLEKLKAFTENRKLKQRIFNELDLHKEILTSADRGMYLYEETEEDSD